MRDFWMRTKRKRKRAEADPLLGRLLSAEEMRTRTQGFVAIYERRGGTTRLYLRQRDGIRDGQGRVYPDTALNWAEYGRGWRAYTISAMG